MHLFARTNEWECLQGVILICMRACKQAKLKRTTFKQFAYYNFSEIVSL